MDSPADSRSYGEDDIKDRASMLAETMPLGDSSRGAGHTNRPGQTLRNGARREGTEKEGDEVGHYKLLTPLGSGGFGTVWLAKRMSDFEQMVAIKVVKLGMDSQAVLERFGQEMQLLALMDHPHVAKVFDAGTTPSGRPFFVMERVDGQPLTRYADEHRLTIEERLRLFLQVCDAIQYAHHKEIVHRDLKPSNILVAADGSGGANAKVIDFGVAQALTRRMSEHTVHAESGQMIGTPEYMSPEQAQGSEDVDGRSDVYSLGVILYELLVGVTPFDGKRLRSNGQSEIQRIIREDDPPTPSVRLSAIHCDGSEHARRIAQFRRATPHRLASVVRRELGWIPMKAMSKERDDRYATPEALADDVRNYLAGTTVSAVPASPIYRLRKYSRAHSGSLVIALCFAAVTISFAHRLIAEKAPAAVCIEDAEWFLNEAARENSLKPSSLEDALRLQEVKLAELVEQCIELRAVNAQDELILKRSALEGEQGSLKEKEVGTLDPKRLAIAARRESLATLGRQIVAGYAREAWFAFRLHRANDAVRLQALALQELDRLAPRALERSPDERAFRKRHDDALMHYQSGDPADSQPASWTHGTPWSAVALRQPTE